MRKWNLPRGLIEMPDPKTTRAGEPIPEPGAAEPSPPAGTTPSMGASAGNRFVEDGADLETYMRITPAANPPRGKPK